MSLVTILLILLVFAAFGGGTWAGPGPGYYGGYGLGSLLVIVLIVLLVTGRL